jgi:hypothetical protein
MCHYIPSRKLPRGSSDRGSFVIAGIAASTFWESQPQKTAAITEDNCQVAMG